MQPFDQCQEVDPLILEVDAVGSQMDACEDNFLVTFLRQDLYFLLHVLRPAASDAASRVRDDAIAAELVASVLDFDERTGVFRLLFNVKLLVLIGSREVRDGLFDLFSGKPGV